MYIYIYFKEGLCIFIYTLRKFVYIYIYFKEGLYIFIYYLRKACIYLYII